MFFGKTMENSRERISVKLVNNVKGYVRYISKPKVFSQKIFSKNFVGIDEIQPVLTLNTPIYEFHYKYIKSKFDANLLFTDPDSLVLKLREDAYEDFYKDKNLFGFSDYSLNSKFFDPVNKKGVGKMMDETSIVIEGTSSLFSLFKYKLKQI